MYIPLDVDAGVALLMNTQQNKYPERVFIFKLPKFDQHVKCATRGKNTLDHVCSTSSKDTGPHLSQTLDNRIIYHFSSPQFTGPLSRNSDVQPELLKSGLRVFFSSIFCFFLKEYTSTVQFYIRTSVESVTIDKHILVFTKKETTEEKGGPDLSEELQQSLQI